MRAVERHDENVVAVDDDRDALHSDERHALAAGTDKIAVAVVQERVAADRIAVGILAASEGVDGLPTSEIRPAHRHGNDGDAVITIGPEYIIAIGAKSLRMSNGDSLTSHGWTTFADTIWPIV